MAARPRHIIYGLKHPTTHLIHYIGLTSTGLKRPESYRRSSSPESRARDWVRTIQAEGLNYETVVLEEFTSLRGLPAAECWWIAYGRCSGWPLVNYSLGGTGVRLNNAHVYNEIDARENDERLLLFCKRLYKVDQNRAIEAARRCVSPEAFERFKVNVIDHDLTMPEDPPLRLACPCGQTELLPFQDSDSLTSAVLNLNSHIRDMAQQRREKAHPSITLARLKRVLNRNRLASDFHGLLYTRLEKCNEAI